MAADDDDPRWLHIAWRITQIGIAIAIAACLAVAVWAFTTRNDSSQGPDGRPTCSTGLSQDCTQSPSALV
ncbi:MAG: hypothetical protein JWM05_3722 [Acidimicrobiales bacterium]|nr:hypothetical protein [Acidimicrobiales bacterium]